jgi:PqqD family protein of HPr-rel-A system
MRLQRVPGLRLEPVGSMWAAYSPLSGRTSLLNDLSAAVLEVLDQGPASEEALFSTLSSDSATDVEMIQSLVTPAIKDLADAGLIRTCPA